MDKRIVVVGAGAIGGYTGGQLAHNGFDVTLIDPWPEHIEAIRNAWSVRELSRQIASLLFDRFAKSKDKKGLMELATRGQEVMRPIDVLKDPTVIEFLELPESPRLVESKGL
jgi:2-polyprenyl-6-methoxyphenol hydroxylase-like FAD-dependent oxidoreductase